MKLISSIIFSIIGQISVAQQQMDTTISKQILESIKTENYNLKKSNKRIVYQNRLLSDLKSIDTIHATNDSIVISYLTKERLLLKRIIKKYRSPNCQAYETEEFFNDKGLPEYLEYWTFDCRSQKDVAEDEKIFPKLIYSYERIVYDSIGRVIARVFIYSSQMPGPRRYEYHYAPNGKVSTQMKRIPENEFWD